MKQKKKRTEGFLWLGMVLLVGALATACGAIPDGMQDPGQGPEKAMGSEPEVAKVQSALTSSSIWLRPVADITPKEWVERPAFTPHWQILNTSFLTGSDDFSCAWSGRDVETNSLPQWTDITQLDSSFINQGVSLTGGTLWACARQYTFVDPKATLQTILRWRRPGLGVIKTVVLTPNLATMLTSGPNNPGTDFQPRWYAFTIPTFGTFIAGDTIEAGLRTSAVGGGRVQVFKYVVLANVTFP